MYVNETINKTKQRKKEEKAMTRERIIELLKQERPYSENYDYEIAWIMNRWFIQTLTESDVIEIIETYF